MSDNAVIEYTDDGPLINWRPPKLYGVYVLFHDADAEPLGVENVVDFEDRAEVFFMVDAEGRRWFLPHRSYRWIEVTPMETL